MQKVSLKDIRDTIKRVDQILFPSKLQQIAEWREEQNLSFLIFKIKKKITTILNLHIAKQSHLFYLFFF